MTDDDVQHLIKCIRARGRETAAADALESLSRDLAAARDRIAELESENARLSTKCNRLAGL